MEDLLIAILYAKFGYPVKLQGSLLEDEPYPDNFFTFWNRNSNGDSYYDNEAKTTIYVYDVNFYSNNPESVYTVLREAIADLKNAGFIISGDGHSIASDVPTHDGRGVVAMFIGIC